MWRGRRKRQVERGGRSGNWGCVCVYERTQGDGTAVGTEVDAESLSLASVYTHWLGRPNMHSLSTKKLGRIP